MNQDTATTKLGLPAIDGCIVPSTADQLFSWMRTFWTHLYKDKQFLKSLQGSRALRYAQLYLDLLENIQLLDHTDTPVFHRERWYPIVVRKNRRNNADAATMRIGDDAVLTNGTQAGFESKIRIGRHVDRSDVVAYSLDDDVVDVVSCVVDSIAKPSVILNNGSDFRIDRKSIVISKEHDPFNDDSLFPKFDVVDEITGESTQETVLWACDTLIDKDFVFKHSGYAVDLKGKSSELYRNVVRAVWDATSDGLSPAHLRIVIGALCGVPTVIEDAETIQTIYTCDGMRHVITDKNVYTFGENAVLRDCVKAGNTIFHGDFLDTAVRLYPFITSVADVTRKTEFSEYTFKKDISSVSIPKAIIRGPLDTGFYAGWDEKDVVCRGFDANGNPKLMFDLGTGNAEKELKYWNFVWSEAEKSKVSIEDCFDGIKNDSISEGSVCGSVQPIAFFLKNLIGANTLFVFVDTDKLAAEAPLFDPNFYNTLRQLIPAHIRLYFIEHGNAIDGQDDEIDEQDDSDVSVTAGSNYDESDDEFDDIDDYVVSSKWTKRCRRRHDDDDDDEY